MYSSCKSSYQPIADYYERNRKQLLAYIACRMGSCDDAEDILQDAFLRLLKSEKMISEVTLPCLVYTVVGNLIIDYYRAKNHRKNIALNNDMAVYADDCAAACVANDLKEHLEKEICRLPENCRKVYYLSLYEEKKMKDICIELNMDYKQVDNRLSYARSKVRKHFSKLIV